MPFFLETRREGQQAERLEIEISHKVVVGRSEEADLKIAGDQYISRKHVEVWVEDGRLKVRKLSATSNPVVYHGEASDEFTVSPGDWFAIGSTRIAFIAEQEFTKLESDTAMAPRIQQTMAEADLYAMSGASDRMRLLDLLELPEMLRTMKREDFFVHLAGLVRLATGARWTSITTQDGGQMARDSADDRQETFTMSKSLVGAALKQAPCPTLYVWGSPSGDFKATMQEGTDWAICAAMKAPSEAALILYVAGEGGGGSGAEQRHRDNAKFVGLVADMVARSLSIQRLETWHGRLERYFAGPVIRKITESTDGRDMEPRIAPATIMFFDIRGFSKRTEGQNERIMAYLGELRRVMTAMTEEIFHEDGVVLQYLGDGIMACWNVPIEKPDHVAGAVRAALRMEKRLGELTDGWRCGIGIHTGDVVAGAIGSDLMFNYGVMGAVVNQSSRVEGITKHVETPILVTREVAEKLTPEVALTRRIGRFQPAGMKVALDLFEPMAPGSSREQVSIYEKGLEIFERGEWEEAYKALDRLGPEDLPARFLKSLAETYRRRPPKDWQGIIELIEK